MINWYNGNNNNKNDTFDDNNISIKINWYSQVQFKS